MNSFLSEHPTLRGFLIIAVIAAVIAALSLQPTLGLLFLIVQIAFLIAIVFFVYRFWRERRSDIAMWPRRAYVAFYGGAALAIVALVVYFVLGASGISAVAFLVILALCAFSMFRVWREQHHYA